MHFALLSQYPDNGSSQRLLEEAARAGHRVDIIDHTRCHVAMSAEGPSVFFEGYPLPRFDGIIPRIGASVTFAGVAVVRQFEAMGVLSLSPADAIQSSRDKLRSLQLLAAHHVAVPVTAFGPRDTSADSLINAVGDTPVIVKILEGTQGIGVVLCETRQAARSTIEGFRAVRARVLVQEYIAEAAGADLRCFVIGDRVIGAMTRHAAPGDFRSNLHRGGTARTARLSGAERQAALRATRAMNLQVAGVDILRSDRGPLVLEVNSSPGLQGIEAATRKNVAKGIVEHLESMVRRAR